MPSSARSPAAPARGTACPSAPAPLTRVPCRPRTGTGSRDSPRAETAAAWPPTAAQGRTMSGATSRRGSTRGRTRSASRDRRGCARSRAGSRRSRRETSRDSARTTGSCDERRDSERDSRVRQWRHPAVTTCRREDEDTWQCDRERVICSSSAARGRSARRARWTSAVREARVRISVYSVAPTIAASGRSSIGARAWTNTAGYRPTSIAAMAPALGDQSSRPIAYVDASSNATNARLTMASEVSSR